MIRLIFLLLALSTYASAETAEQYFEHDKSQCQSQASEKHTWVLHPVLWRASYNSCLRERLRVLSSTYTHNALEAVHLESECPQILLNEQPTELSMLGFEIVNHLTPKEMESAIGTNNIEYHLKLYYQRTIAARDRVRDLRRK
ncbi:MAG: hypothetical protein ACJ76H_14345 [Bacteriovoracaceae bacterium]